MNRDILKCMAQVNLNIKEILKGNYIGVYFHGSLRLGSFNPYKSDLDFIIVVKDKLNSDTKRKICDWMMSNKEMFPKKGFEFSVVLEKYCRCFIYPTPYELHMSRVWEEKYLSDAYSVINDNYKTDCDLASHFNVINVANKAMDFGAPSELVFSKVPKKFVIASNWSDIRNAQEDILTSPTYTILNLCRFYAYIKEGVTLSKYDGGKWALSHLTDDFHNVIQLAMRDYISSFEIEYDKDILCDFAEKFMSLIKTETNFKKGSEIYG